MLSWRNLAILFASGALGGLATALAIWLAGDLGITAVLGVKIKAALTPPFIYNKVVWGGLWGALFLLPLFAGSWWKRGVLFSLGPTVATLLYFLPQKGLGLFGTGLGAWTPVAVIGFNLIWGLTTAASIRAAGEQG